MPGSRSNFVARYPDGLAFGLGWCQPGGLIVTLHFTMLPGARGPCGAPPPSAARAAQPHTL